LRPNPKYSLSPSFAKAIRFYREHEPRVSLVRKETSSGYALSVEPEPRGRRRIVAVIDFETGAVTLPQQHSRLMPTEVHLLTEVAQAVPELGDFMVGFGRTWNEPPELSGLTLADVAEMAAEVTETGYADWPAGTREYTFVYRALPPLEEMRLYHATLAARVPSIMERGLRPSGLGQERIEGWSPGWNMGLQEAVYLFVDPVMALRVAMTLSERAGEDAVVLEVEGRSLTDTLLRVPDEDALRSSLDDSVLWEGWDRDFPPWVTSAESRTQSLGYAATIPPAAIELWLTLLWAPDVWEEDGEEFYEARWEPTGPAENVEFAEAALGD
jgi:hypothetical protein